ncbi:MAG TPA: hypothetical protein VGG79_07870 [Roseiarcus sp.]|jgi:hypothetical protein
MTTSPPTRRPPKLDTERALAIRASTRHLNDLRRAQRQPPANVAVSERGVPKFVPLIIEQSWCTSPAALCADLGEVRNRPQSVGATELAELTELTELAELGAELSELEAEFAELLK